MFTIGVDEVGRGSIAGPATVCAVVVRTSMESALRQHGIQDSKQMSEKQRRNAYIKLQHTGTLIETYSIVSRSAEQVDLFGINEAIWQAANDAVNAVYHCSHLDMTGKVDRICLDKGLKSDWAIFWESLNIEVLEAPRDGETLYPSVAAASILAKVARDDYMTEMSTHFPEYSFESNKGYGSKGHYEAVGQFGLIEGFHRRSFFNKGVGYQYVKHQME